MGYTIYGGELSYFSRKLEAAMIFYQADFEFKPKGPANAADIEHRSGTHQVPVLHTPENWMIGDTTPLMMMLDGRFPQRRMFPEGAPGALVHVLEEYFDEWIARTMVHYRWHYEESAHFAALRMSGGNEQATERILSWGPRACRATGTESPVQQTAAEEEYVRILAAMESQLSITNYMLGSRPCAVDCILLGGLRAHTYMDPTPKRVTEGYPKVVDWCLRLADGWDGTGTIDYPSVTPFAQFVADEMVNTYKPYLLANHAAVDAGAKAFHADIYGETVSYLTRAYPPFSASLISQRLNQLSGADRDNAEQWLSEHNLLECFQ